MKITIFSLATLMTASLHGVIIISDDFSSGTVEQTFRMAESDIDGAWKAASAGGGSAWQITGGGLSNASNDNTAGYPNYLPSQGPAAFTSSMSGIPATDTQITISFDYVIAVGDALNIQLIGHVGTFDSMSSDWIGNVEGDSSYNNPGTGPNASSTLSYDQLFSNVISAGTGTYTTTVNLATAGVVGVDSADDLAALGFSFAKIEDGIVGTTTVDNLVITTIPEPTGGALLALSTLGLLVKRRR